MIITLETRPTCLDIRKLFLNSFQVQMKPISVVICTLVTFFLVLEIESMGICFGGYPACCANGKNTCGPFCASCSRVDEFLHNMMMFMMHGMGTPGVFRIINPDPFVRGPTRPVPFPAKPFPTNNSP